MALVAVDTYAAASHRNARDNLVPVLQSGAVDEAVPIDGNGRAVVAWTREPLLLLAPATPIDVDGLRAAVVMEPQGAATPLATVTFAPFSDAGSFLPVWPTGAVTASPFTVGITLTRLVRDGLPTPVAAADVGTLVELRLLEGVLGRLLYVMGAEKQRIRRVAREVATSRLADSARAASLDRIGRDLGMVRFSDALAFSTGPPAEIVTTPRAEPDGRESDMRYRWRLHAMGGLRMANRSSVLEALNGPGTPTDPPAGALAGLGPQPAARLRVDDRPAPFALAVHLVAGGNDAARLGFLDALRRDRLVRPVPSNAVTTAYDERFLTADERAALDDLGTDLRNGFNFTGDAANDPAMAIGLARALARVAACRGALGASTRWALTRAQLGNGGNRYELGLGADLTAPSAAEVNALRTAVLADDRQPADDPEVEALLRAMAAANPDPSDDELRWLLEPCGLATVHRTSGTTLFVSHLPMQGLTITAPSVAPLGGWSHLVAGLFTGISQWSQTVLRYRDADGRAEAVGFDDGGHEHVLASFTGWRTTWSEILKFSPPVVSSAAAARGDGLLFYDRTAGEAAAVFLDRGNTATTIGTASGWRKSWRLLAAGLFTTSAELTDLARYDPTTGDVELVSLAADLQETKLDVLRRQRSSWTAMVALRIDDGDTDALVLYDRFSGSVEVHRVGAGNRLVLTRSQSRWRPGYSHLVAAPRLVMHSGLFAGSILVGYDRDGGTIDIIRITPEGELSVIGSQPVPRRLLSHVTTGAIVPSRTTSVLFYDRATGIMAVFDTPLETSDEHGRLPVGGPVKLQLRGFAYWDATPDAAVEARVLGAGDSASHVLLSNALTRATAAWSDRGGEGFAIDTAPAAQLAVWQQAIDPGAAADSFTGAGLPFARAQDNVATPLGQLPPELVATLRLGPTLAAAVTAGGAVDEVRGFIGVLAAAGIDSALALVTGPGQVAIVVGVIGLPISGVNLSDRRSSGFRWYTVAIGDQPGVIKPVGSRTRFRPVAYGVTALVGVAHLRDDRPDPYEVRIDLPEGATLDLDQYELIMNVLDQWHPLGVEVNTFRIRRAHVDLDGDGVADPLPPSFARTFRQYRRRTNAATATTFNTIAP
jgi:hypothetical protein